jgi:hypothetical protein
VSRASIAESSSIIVSSLAEVLLTNHPNTAIRI